MYEEWLEYGMNNMYYGPKYPCNHKASSSALLLLLRLCITYDYRCRNRQSQRICWKIEILWHKEKTLGVDSQQSFMIHGKILVFGLVLSIPPKKPYELTTPPLMTSIDLKPKPIFRLIILIPLFPNNNNRISKKNFFFFSSSPETLAEGEEGELGDDLHQGQKCLPEIHMVTCLKQ